MTNDRLLTKYEAISFINTIAENINLETRGEINTETACNWLHRVNFTEDWTIWERNHRPVDIDTIIYCMRNN